MYKAPSHAHLSCRSPRLRQRRNQEISSHSPLARSGDQKSLLYTHTRPEVVKGDLHRGHSAFWLCQSAMHCQQKTWPQGVAVGKVRAPKHSAHFLCCGTSPTSAAAVTSCSGAASSFPKSCRESAHNIFTLFPCCTHTSYSTETEGRAG